MSTDRKTGSLVTSSSARDVFAVLRTALATEDALTIAEIGRRLRMSNNKAYRAVTTLEHADYLKRNAETGGFSIGAAAEQLVHAAFRRLPIRSFMIPYLRQIATSAEETVCLVVRVGWYGVRAASIESLGNIVARANRLGAATMLNDDAAGLAILSALPPAEIKRFLAFERARKQKGGGSRPDQNLAVRMQDALASGFSTFANEQFNAVGIPLRGAAGRCVAAIAIEAPVSRATALQRDPRLPDWLAVAAKAEASLQEAAERFVDPFASLDPDGVVF